MSEPRLGGHPEGARLAAAVPGAVLKPHTLNPVSDTVRSGGVPYDPVAAGEVSSQCTRLTKTGNVCKAPPTATGLCAGHSRQAAAESK